MTTDLLDAPAIDSGRAGFPEAVRSEWAKLRSVRSTWISLIVIVVAGLGFAALFSAVIANHWKQSGPLDRAQFDPVRISQAGSFITQIVVGVLGGLIVCSEYANGSIRTTLAALPRRTTVVTSKAVVTGVVLLVITECTAFASFFVSQAVLLASGGRQLPAGSSLLDQAKSAAIPVLSISSSGVPMALLRTGLYLTLMGILAVGLGFLLRNTTATISVYVVVLLVIPILIQLLPSSVREPIQPYLPSNLGVAMETVGSTHTDWAGTLLSAWPATLVIIGYSAVILAAGAVLLNRRDA